MTNLEKWRTYTRHLFSPDSFINFAWFYTVSAALQRRVWHGKLEGDPLFPNLYIVLTGPASVGKGIVLGKVIELLRFHKISSSNTTYSKIMETHYLFPPGPDDITYEKLCHKLASNTQRSRMINGEGKEKPYSYASMAFVLEEVETLFTKRENKKMNKLLLKAYDCKDHEYDTKHQGNDIIRNPCMSILGGCVPSFIPEGIKMGILEDGTVSRTIFIFEIEPRMNTFWMGQPDENDLRMRNDLLAHIKKLSELRGEIQYESGVREWLENWFQTVHVPKAACCHPKMVSYHGRMRVHVLKLATAIHFSDSLDMILRKEDCELAIEMLGSIEKRMEIGFAAAGRNVMSAINREIVNFIRSQGGTSTMADLFIQFEADLQLKELQERLLELNFAGKVQTTGNIYKLRE